MNYAEETTAAIESVEANANEAWMRAAFDTVKNVAEGHAEFSVDEVMEIMEQRPEKTRTKRALGAVMLRAKKAGLIENTGTFLRSKRPSEHNLPITVWRSKILKPDAQ